MESSAPPTQTGHDSRGIVRRGGISLLGAVFGGVLVVVNEILAARFLGVHYYGCYALGNVAARFFEIVSLAGLQIGVVHFVSRFHRRGDHSRIVGTILAASMFPLVTSVFWIIVIWNIAPWLATVVLKEPDAIPYLRAFAFAIPPLCFSDLLAHVTRAFGFVSYHVLIRTLVPSTTYFVSLILLLLVQPAHLWIAAAFTCAYWMATVVGVVSVVKVTEGMLWRIRPAAVWGELYAFSFPVVINILLYVTLGATDLVMISALRSTEEVSFYRGAMQLVAVFPVIITAFGAGAAHIYAVLSDEGRKAELDRAYRTTTNWILFATAVAGVTIFLNRVGLLALLGPRFVAAAPALAILAAAQFVRSTSGSAPLLLILSRHQRLETINVLLGVTINISLNFLLVPRWGMTGAATATCIAYLTMTTLQMGQVWRFLGLHTLRAASFRCIAVAISVIALEWLIRQATGWSDNGRLVDLCVRVPLVAVLTGAGIWWFALDAEDHQMVKAVWNQREATVDPLPAALHEVAEEQSLGNVTL